MKDVGIVPENVCELFHKLHERMIERGALVDSTEASRRRGKPVQTADVDELVVIAHRDRPYYVSSVLKLPARDVVRVNRALGSGASNQCRLVFWTLRSSDLGGRTVTGAIRRRDVERCVELAATFAFDQAIPLAGHARLDARSLAIHRTVARKLLANPGVLEQARETLRMWSSQHPAPVYEEWHRILASSSSVEVAEFISSTGEEAERLRQSSPFSVLVTPEQRTRIFEEYSAARPSSTSR